MVPIQRVFATQEEICVFWCERAVVEPLGEQGGLTVKSHCEMKPVLLNFLSLEVERLVVKVCTLPMIINEPAAAYLHRPQKTLATP